MRKPRGRVLVLDGGQPVALAVARSLSRHGLSVDCAGHEPRFLSSYSRHCGGSLVYPDPIVDSHAFTDWVREQVHKEVYEMVVPVTDDTLQPLAKARETLGGTTRLAAAPNEALTETTEKQRTLEIAERLGVPVPVHCVVRTEDELVEAVAGHPLLSVLKPNRSMARRAGDVRTRLAVRYAHSREETLQIGRSLLGYGPVILQEYFRGRGVGVEVLVDQGEVVYAFQHLRLHELPLTGGGSTLRESVRLDPVLLEDVRKLMKAVGYHGVAMIEFKQNPETGARCFMEINGRFWGSLPLAVAAGADFPAFLYDLLVHGRRPDAAPARTGVLCRKLAADANWLIAVLRRTDPNPLVDWPSRSGALLELLRVFLPRHRFDVQSIRDPVPGVVELIRAVVEINQRVFRTLRRKRLLAQAQRLRTDAEILGSRLRKAKEILFLCYGNINRSILAEKCLNRRGPGPRFLSAGFHPRAGRPPDPTMVDIAARHGVSLEDALSRCINASMVDSADLVFVMDARQLLRFREEYPEASDKAWLLGVVGSSSQPLEVADPYGKDRASYERCFREIQGLTSALAARLEET